MTPIENDSNFLAGLMSLLNGEIRPRSEVAIHADEFCKSIDRALTKCYEAAHAIDALPNGFHLSQHLESNVRYPLQRMKDIIEKPWLADKLTIGILGHFSVGKTRILNLILSENLPINKSENTALATYLTYGTDNDMSIVTKAGVTLSLSQTDSTLLDFQGGNKKFPFARIFNYIVKENSSPLLESLTIIDTPGLGGNLEHSEPTETALEACDAVIWVTKLTASIGDEDLKFIKEKISKAGKKLYMILSFVDETEYPDPAFSVIKERLYKADIKVEDFFFFGIDTVLQKRFYTNITRALRAASEKHEAYIPMAHILYSIEILESYMIQFRSDLTKEYNALDKETDNLQDAYNQERGEFVNEGSNCIKIWKQVCETFSNHCAGSLSCGSSDRKMLTVLNAFSTALVKMNKAYDKIDPDKLFRLGRGVEKMITLKDKILRASSIIEDLQNIKISLK